MPDVDLQKFASRCAINPPGNYMGPAIATAATITFSHPVHKVTTGLTVLNINPPYPGFCGHVTILAATGDVALGAGGNISIAKTITNGTAMQLFYDGAVWWPAGA